MERLRSWEIITKRGNYLKNKWQQIADRHKLKIVHNGLPALAGYTFDSEDSIAYKTLITQEMLKKGFLAGTSCYLCQSHDDEIIIERYKQSLEEVFFDLKTKDDEQIKQLINGDLCHTGFERLN